MKPTSELRFLCASYRRHVEAALTFSRGEVDQPVRSVIEVAKALFASMPVWP